MRAAVVARQAVGAGLVVVAASVERADIVRGRCRQATKHVITLHLQVRGDLVDRGSPPIALRQFFGTVAYQQVEFLGTAGDAHGPRPIAEVPLQFAFDRAAGERGERCAVLGIEPIDGLDQADHRHLAQVVVALAPKAIRNVRRETHVPFDELVAQLAALRRGEGSEQLEVVEIVRCARVAHASGVVGSAVESVVVSTVVVATSDASFVKVTFAPSTA